MVPEEQEATFHENYLPWKTGSHLHSWDWGSPSSSTLGWPLPSEAVMVSKAGLILATL